jgi:hypothetical protein
VPVGLGADRVDDRVVESIELRLRDVPPDLHVAEEAEAGPLGDSLERSRDGLEIRVVGRDAEPDEAPRRRQPLDHVHLDVRILAREQMPRGVEGSRTRTHDGDAHGG